MNTLERWRPITEYQGHEFDGSHEVSSWGRVRKADGTIMLPYSDNRGQGYMRIKLYDRKGKRVALKIHRLVAYSFLPKGETNQEVNHIDGNPKNNSWTNLEWVTHEQNMEHYRKGREAV